MIKNFILEICIIMNTDYLIKEMRNKTHLLWFLGLETALGLQICLTSNILQPRAKWFCSICIEKCQDK